MFAVNFVLPGYAIVQSIVDNSEKIILAMVGSSLFLLGTMLRCSLTRHETGSRQQPLRSDFITQNAYVENADRRVPSNAQTNMVQTL